MTNAEIKNIVENNIPENWEYAHDHYIDEAIENIDIDGMIAEGWTEKEIAQEIEHETMNLETYAFEKASEDILNADGVMIDEDGIRIDDELYTNEHAQELESIARDAIKEEIAERKFRNSTYWW